jgi:hypothetical protein
MFLSTGELNPDYIHPDDRQPLTEEQQIAVAKSIPLTNKAIKQGFTMDEKGNAVKVSPEIKSDLK